MSIDSPPIPPVTESEGSNKNRKILLGCLIALILALIVLCCGISLVLMPLFSDVDPLGIGIREQIEDFLPADFLDDPSSIPDFEDFLDETDLDLDLDEPVIEPAFVGEGDAWDVPLAYFYFTDIMTSFDYPAGWDIEMEGYSVTFYHPEDFTYIYLGEVTMDEESPAEDVAMDFIKTIEEDAQEGSFHILSGTDYSLALAADAYLVLFEWVDEDGYYNWAYDLEIVSGDSNLFILLVGEIEEEIPYYGDLLDIIASSMIAMEE